MTVRRLILRSFQSPGDVLVMTAAVRDLHLAQRGQFETDVRTAADALWLNNPYITRLSEGQPGVECIDMHYPLIRECNQRPYHFIHGYPQYLEQQLGVRIPVTRFAGDIHLSAEEMNSPPPGADLGVGEHFWIIMAGGKYDFTAKWWNPTSYQKVVDHFQGRIRFVQCGEAGHWHPPLEGVVNLVGKTDTRAFVRLMHHADGVVCPVTFAMHLAAAVEAKPGRPRQRPCVVIAGGREPPQWEAYPQHQFLSTVGALPCCADGGCWKSRCQPVGDGDQKDHHDLCVDPVQVRGDLRIPRCMDLITPEHVIDRIELYYRGGALKFSMNGHLSFPPLGRGGQGGSGESPISPGNHGQHEMSGDSRGRHVESRSETPTNGTIAAMSESQIPNPKSEITMNVLITFGHGFGDAVQLGIVLKHLQKYRPTWNVDVAALVGKHTAYRGLCRTIYIHERESPPCCQYQQRFDLGWHECHTSYADSPSTKAEKCLREEFGITPDPGLCNYSIQVSDEARDLARRYLEKVCAGLPPLGRGGQGGSRESPISPAHHDRHELLSDSTGDQPVEAASCRFPVVLIHYEGNTSAEMKNVPAEIIRRLCDDIIEEGFVPVILDWDYRTPLADGVRIHCPDQRSELWHGTGTGDAESLAALTELSSLFIGVDSGPLHAAGTASTPTLGIWTRHHPLHYFSHAGNVTHLVPRNHCELIRGDRSIGDAYFNEHYRFQVYDDLEVGLRAAVRSRLHAATSGLVLTRGFWVRADTAEQDLVIVQDIAEHDAYQIDEMPMLRQVVVDVGAHIGCFTRRFHRRNPLARIFAVECCPENFAALHKNVGEIATVVQGAMTYEPDVALLNAVYRNCVSTGGSTLVPRAELASRVAKTIPPLSKGGPGGVGSIADIARQPQSARNVSRLQGGPGGVAILPQNEEPGSAIRLGEYWADFRPIRTLTLEDLMREHDLDHIDILKLDCEGSEFSILRNTPALDRIGLIVGEYHGKAKFEQLIAERFSGWNLRILQDRDIGIFWLQNPAYPSLPPLGRGGQGGAGQSPISPGNHSVHEMSGDSRGVRISNSRASEVPIPTPEEFSQRLAAAFHASDRPQLPIWLPYYRKLFELACELRPSRICEIGVRAGYSAFALLSANPSARYHGIDSDQDESVANTHCGFHGAWGHAQQILAPFEARIQLANSHALEKLPDSDLIYVDGDHLFDGCLSDLRLAAKASDRILVDDVDSIPFVRQACGTFFSEHPEFHRHYIDNDLTGWLLFERRAEPRMDQTAG